MGRKTISFVVKGEPASKANSRRKVTNRNTGKPMFIKSAKAVGYAESFALQCPKIPDIFTGDVEVEVVIYYGSRRPDLDESLILDGMQGRVYVNDRQVKVRHTWWALDTRDPRAEIRVSSLDHLGVPDLLNHKA